MWKYFCNQFFGELLSDTWAVAALEDEANLTRCCRMITTPGSLSWLSRRGSTPGSTTRPDEPRMTTRPAEPSWTTLSPDSSTRTSSWCHRWFLRYRLEYYCPRPEMSNEWSKRQNRLIPWMGRHSPSLFYSFAVWGRMWYVVSCLQWYQPVLTLRSRVWRFGPGTVFIVLWKHAHFMHSWCGIL